MTSPLYITEAKRRVEEYERLDAVSESRHAMECLDCEAWLKIGIDLFKFLIETDEAIRLAIYSEKVPEGITLDEFDEVCRALMADWLKPTRRANRWIKQCEDRGFVVEHKEEFFKCVRKAELIVQEHELNMLPAGLKPYLHRASIEITNEETQQFFPNAK